MKTEVLEKEIFLEGSKIQSQKGTASNSSCKKREDLGDGLLKISAVTLGSMYGALAAQKNAGTSPENISR